MIDKVCGNSNLINWCRSGEECTRINRHQVIDAVDRILKRLGTEYLDILMLNWPDRYVPMNGAPIYDCRNEYEETISFLEQIEIMNDLIKLGKIRHYGVSNETPFGLTNFLLEAKRNNLPKPVVIQNIFNLVNRNDFESGLVEVCSPLYGGVGLLAASPLAGGSLSGKYFDSTISDTVKNTFRMRRYLGQMYRYITPPVERALADYMQVSKDYDLPLNAIALAYTYSRPFVTSTVIGVANSQQLEDNMHSLNVLMTDELENSIDDVYRKHVDPAKGAYEIIDPNEEVYNPELEPWFSTKQKIDSPTQRMMDERLNQWSRYENNEDPLLSEK